MKIQLSFELKHTQMRHTLTKNQNLYEQIKILWEGWVPKDLPEFISILWNHRTYVAPVHNRIAQHLDRFLYVPSLLNA